MASSDTPAAAAAQADPGDHPDIIAFPPLIASSVAVIAGLLQWLVPIAWPLSGLSRWTALVTFALAALLVSSGRRALVRAGTEVHPNRPTTAIVSDGPYRFTRNPLYLSLHLFELTLAIAARWTWALVMLVPLFLLLHFGVVLREERYLDGKFGETYRAYRSRVRRWF